MKIYLAGPLFTAGELEFNSNLAALLKKAGHDVFLPQAQSSGERTALTILRKLLKALKFCDVVVANMDGPDPDSGTCWECGYAFNSGKPIIAFRTDVRRDQNKNLGPYNLMMWASATARLDGPYSAVAELANDLLPLIDTSALKKGRIELLAKLSAEPNEDF
jgi:nucleoside 2-deoxyribosyltransferase